MTAPLELTPHDRVLEVGIGSGCAAAVLAKVTKELYSIEHHKILADSAHRKLKERGYKNCQLWHGDSTLDWPQYAPLDAIIIAAGGPHVPATLKQQPAIGGRLFIPVGLSLHTQKLLCIRSTGEHEYQQEDLGGTFCAIDW